MNLGLAVLVEHMVVEVVVQHSVRWVFLVVQAQTASSS